MPLQLTKDAAFTTDAADCVAVSLASASILPLLAALAIRFGQVDDKEDTTSAQGGAGMHTGMWAILKIGILSYVRQSEHRSDIYFAHTQHLVLLCQRVCSACMRRRSQRW